MAYDNNNSGSLFRNERKETERHPDYTGSLKVDGVDYWVSGWIKTAGPLAKNPGMKFLSIAVNPKEDTGDRLAAPPIDEDIPF